MRRDADRIIEAAIRAAMPDQAVRTALTGLKLPEKVYVAAIGKAAAQMAGAAYEALGARVAGGVVITKYGHASGDIGPIRVYEAAHPVPDENGVRAAGELLALAKRLSADDVLIFLISGGGSALFESPLIPLPELQDITQQLLASGADIASVNTIRKRLSAVKGGRFAEACAPARVVSVVLSDILGDPLDMIASGPAYPDSATAADAKAILETYGLRLSKEARALMDRETPKSLSNVETFITGSVRQLCAAAAEEARALGYEPIVLTDCLDCEAAEAGRFLSAIARSHQASERSLAFFAGGETIVHLKGKGLGGRNQELALAAAEGIADLRDTAVFSAGSDGTDGPTDAAGGFADGGTKAALLRAGLSIPAVLRENDSYHALARAGGLIVTGPTGTNVNDIAGLLIRR